MLGLVLTGCQVDGGGEPDPEPEKIIISGYVGVTLEGIPVTDNVVVSVCTDATSIDTVKATELGRAVVNSTGGWLIELPLSAAGQTVIFAVLYDTNETWTWDQGEALKRKLNAKSLVIEAGTTIYNDIDLGSIYFVADALTPVNVFAGSVTVADEGVPITDNIAVIACTDNTDPAAVIGSVIGYAPAENGSWIIPFEPFAAGQGIKFVVSYNPAGTWSLEDIASMKTDLNAGIITAAEGDVVYTGIDLGAYFGGTGSEHGMGGTGGWSTWGSGSGGCTVETSVTGGVNTVTVGGTPGSAGLLYNYFPVKEVKYVYQFEAWTDTGRRTLTGQYYQNGNDNVYMAMDSLELTPEHKIFTIGGDAIPKTGQTSIVFSCGDQLGIFHIKVLSIKTMVTGAVSWTEALPETPEVNNNVWIADYPNTEIDITENVITITQHEARENFGGSNAIINYNWADGKVYAYEFEAWTASGIITLNSCYWGGPQFAPVTITTDRQTFTMYGPYPSVETDKSFYLQFGDQTGIFYVKMISIRTPD
jgi:hypothetical protein